MSKVNFAAATSRLGSWISLWKGWLRRPEFKWDRSTEPRKGLLSNHLKDGEKPWSSAGVSSCTFLALPHARGELPLTCISTFPHTGEPASLDQSVVHPVLVCKLWRPARHFLSVTEVWQVQQNYPTWRMTSVCSLHGELFTAKLDMRTCVIRRKWKERRHSLEEHPWTFPLTVWQQLHPLS